MNNWTAILERIIRKISFQEVYTIFYILAVGVSIDLGLVCRLT